MHRQTLLNTALFRNKGITFSTALLGCPDNDMIVQQKHVVVMKTSGKRNGET